MPLCAAPRAACQLPGRPAGCWARSGSGSRGPPWTPHTSSTSAGRLRTRRAVADVATSGKRLKLQIAELEWPAEAVRKALAGRAMDVAIVVVAVATLAELLTDGRPVPALVSAVCGLVLLARRRAPAIAIVAAFAGQLALTALRFGASGFLLKDVRSGELVEAVRTVAAGQSLLSPSITRRLIERFVRAGPGPGPPPAVTGLTPREREVLLLIAEGLSNAEIASRLYPSEATIKTHVNRLLSKLGLRDRVQAVVLAYETGLIKPGHRAS